MNMPRSQRERTQRTKPKRSARTSSLFEMIDRKRPRALENVTRIRPERRYLSRRGKKSNPE